MATKIFHGVPGSYKSSTAMWFEVLTALRSGRVVVTNLQGILSLEEMQRALGEVFPESARLFRISISSDVGVLLVRNFYQWAPIGCLLFLDEIQDIYPNNRDFKEQDYHYKGEGFFDEHLPKELVELYHNEQRKIKGNVNIDDYLDDLGESLFDDRDYLRYPRTLRECFMRHRHYNWDIVLATPDIKEVTPFVRSVCEKAYYHKSRDSIPFSYFKRRPIINEHSAKETGLSIKKTDITTTKKVPLDVFKLYKSTATGKTTKSGLGSSHITWRIWGGLLFIFAYVAYLLYFFFGGDGSETDIQNGQILPVQIPVGSQSPEEIKNPVQKSIIVNEKNISSASDLTFRDSGVSTIIAPNNFVNLPYNAKEIYISAVNRVYISERIHTTDYIFNAIGEERNFSIRSTDLLSMGYQLFHKNDCLVELRNNEFSHYIYCQPTYDRQPIKEAPEPNISEPLIRSAVEL